MQLQDSCIAWAIKGPSVNTQALLEGVGPEGAVYVSMGTLCNFGASEFAAIAAALSDLSHRVIWKLAPGDLPGNASIASLGLAPNVKVHLARHS